MPVENSISAPSLQALPQGWPQADRVLLETAVPPIVERRNDCYPPPFRWFFYWQL